MHPATYALNEETLLDLAIRAKSLPFEQQERIAVELEALIPLAKFGPRWLRGTAPKTWRWEWEYQQRIYQALDRITRGECRRMMLFVPPRHTKTETVTVRYSAWRIEREPTERVIVAAYNQDQANLYARKIRRIVQARVPLAKDSKRVDEWETAEGGGLIARGVGAGVTGRGGNLIVIDDPVKSREEADSDAYRERCWDWYTNDLWTRQEPGCAILLILTRWHEDDLAGRLLQAQKDGGEFAEQWEVLNFPALAEENDPLGREPGEALCPERFDEHGLQVAKTVLGRNFYALYQGRPQAAEGAIFKQSWFRYHTEEGAFYVLHHPDGKQERVRKADCWRFATGDFAASEKTNADWTVVPVWAVTPRRQRLLLDVLRERWEGPEAKGLVRTAFTKHNLSSFVVERNGLALPMVQDLLREGYPVRGVVVHRDKVARAQGSAAYYEAGLVYHAQGAAWLDAWEAEHLTFPNGAHDDQVDTGSLAAESIKPGMEIISEFYEPLHVAHDPLEIDPALPLLCGWCFDPYPAWIIGQLDATGAGREGTGQYRVLACAVGGPEEGAYTFAERILHLLRRQGLDPAALDLRHFAHPRHCGVKGHAGRNMDAWMQLATGVPAVVGYDERRRPEKNGRAALGVRLIPGDPDRHTRDEALRGRLKTLERGIPALAVDPGCRPLIAALTGGYCWKVQVSTGLPTGEVDPNPSSALVEALTVSLGGLYAGAPRPDEDEGWGPVGTASGAGRRRERV